MIKKNIIIFMIDRLNFSFLLLVSVNIAFLSGWICECILWINSFLCSVLLQLVILCICYIFIVIKIMFYAIYMTEIIWIIHWWKRNNLNKVWQLVIQTFGHLFFNYVWASNGISSASLWVYFISGEQVSFERNYFITVISNIL